MASNGDNPLNDGLDDELQKAAASAEQQQQQQQQQQSQQQQKQTQGTGPDTEGSSSSTNTSPNNSKSSSESEAESEGEEDEEKEEQTEKEKESEVEEEDKEKESESESKVKDLETKETTQSETNVKKDDDEGESNKEQEGGAETSPKPPTPGTTKPEIEDPKSSLATFHEWYAHFDEELEIREQEMLEKVRIAQETSLSESLKQQATLKENIDVLLEQQTALQNSITELEKIKSQLETEVEEEIENKNKLIQKQEDDLERREKALNEKIELYEQHFKVKNERHKTQVQLETNTLVAQQFNLKAYERELKQRLKNLQDEERRTGMESQEYKDLKKVHHDLIESSQEQIQLLQHKLRAALGGSMGKAVQGVPGFQFVSSPKSSPGPLIPYIRMPSPISPSKIPRIKYDEKDKKFKVKTESESDTKSETKSIGKSKSKIETKSKTTPATKLTPKPVLETKPETKHETILKSEKPFKPRPLKKPETKRDTKSFSMTPQFHQAEVTLNPGDSSLTAKAAGIDIPWYATISNRIFGDYSPEEVATLQSWTPDRRIAFMMRCQYGNISPMDYDKESLSFVLKTIPKLEPGDGVSSSGVVLPLGQPAVSPVKDEGDDESAPKKKARITKKKPKVEKVVKKTEPCPLAKDTDPPCHEMFSHQSVALRHAKSHGKQYFPYKCAVSSCVPYDGDKSASLQMFLDEESFIAHCKNRHENLSWEQCLLSARASSWGYRGKRPAHKKQVAESDDDGDK